ncbi:hypothetical protein ICW40_05210 [Actinotalea ferrariae]|uniref:DUF4352 domain-containing protein n=1 Tax=Actinotalea ferrariae TaxID=1386098 RepID=UPI001C8B4ADB|nr:DUF4352 domain-containing protein [Actinotalea ferrariae]MBX9244204.1 hypothetical protein [Actinotalea ferrariae]
MRRHLIHVALAVLVLAGGLVINHAERHETTTRPFVVTGRVGDRVPVWPGGVVVHGARAGKVADDGYGGEVRTQGVWVAVDVSFAGGDQPGPLAELRLVDAEGRTYDATDRLDHGFLGEPQPASPVRAEVVFEVPEDALGRLTVVADPLYQGKLGQRAHVDVVVDEVEPAVLLPARAVLEEPW